MSWYVGLDAQHRYHCTVDVGLAHRVAIARKEKVDRFAGLLVHEQRLHRTDGFPLGDGRPNKWINGLGERRPCLVDRDIEKTDALVILPPNTADSEPCDLVRP